MSSRTLLLRLAKRYPRQILTNILLGFSGGLFNGVSTALIVPVLLSMLGQDAIFRNSPPILRALLQPFDGLTGDTRVIMLAIAIIFIIALKNLTGYLNALSSVALSRGITSDLQETGLRLLLEVDLAFFTRTRAGDLMNAVGGEMARTTGVITATIAMVTTSITILVFLGLLLSISWPLTLVATLLLPLSTLLNRHWIKRARQFGKQISELSNNYATRVIEVLSGIRLIKATGNEQTEYGRLSHLIRERERVEFQSQMNSAAISPINELTNIIVLFLLVLISRNLFKNQLESLSAILLTYLVILFRMMPFIGQLNGIRNNLARASSALEVVNELLRRDNKPFMANGSLPFTRLQHQIEFRQLSFTYPKQAEPVLQDINLTLPKGTSLALVGSSGAGKSTLADLLPRFYDPTGGSIILDGLDLREFDVPSLRRAMGIVSQDTFLFNDSIRNNIAYARPEATDDEIITAAKRANAHEFIQRLPQGFETMIGDRGVMLSGGQRQRLAIARALLQDPEILILDEATSALDTVSERLVQAAIDELTRERTTLVIAHRLSTVQKAHQIAVMERGRVVELGTHENLLKQGGLYSRLHAMQFADTNLPSPQQLAQKQGIAQLSFEIRTRLNAMLGSLRLLSDELLDTPEERQEIAEDTYESANALLRLVEDLESKADFPASPNGSVTSCDPDPVAAPNSLQ